MLCMCRQNISGKAAELRLASRQDISGKAAELRLASRKTSGSEPVRARQAKIPTLDYIVFKRAGRKNGICAEAAGR